MKLIITLTFSMLISFNSFAGGCPTPVTHLLNDQPAPCEGYLFSPEKEKEVRTIDTNYNTLQQLVEQQNDLNNNLNEQIINLNNQKDILVKQSTEKTWAKIEYFILGSLTTIAMVYVAKKISP